MQTEIRSNSAGGASDARSLKKNSAREEDNELWLVRLDAGFGSNTLVTGERLLDVARVRCQGKRMTKSHRIPSWKWVYGMDDGMDGT